MEENKGIIKIGNGLIKIDSKVMNICRGKALLIKVKEIKGPCKDDRCQIIYKTSAEILPIDDYLCIEQCIRRDLGNTTVLMERKIFDSIEKGREKVRIKISITGKIKIKGFTPC
ncbi:hypothetical protein ACNF40_00520 [Cuniculiplasma sp. SKW4]|uniref:hypothetical protein n=1 Tax=Cuniculiplasma sp. SKW4 TaxID=3400171 RepID=UPI003FD5A510